MRLEAVNKLSGCKHPEATWLREVLDRGADSEFVKNRRSNQGRRAYYTENHEKKLGRLLSDRVLLAEWFDTVATSTTDEKESGRATFFSAVFGKTGDALTETMMISACLGYAPAQAWLSQNAMLPVVAQFRWAELSAAQHDPDGLYQLGHFYLNGLDALGLEPNHLKGSVLMMNAAHAGHVSAQCVRARLFPPTDPETSMWFHRAALGGVFSRHYGEHIVALVSGFSWEADRERKRAIFGLGKLLSGVIDFDTATLYKDTIWKGDGVSGKTIDTVDGSSNFYVCATEAICLFEHWSRKTREAVDAWTGSALRLNADMGGAKKPGCILIPKDIRKLIGQYVWASRGDGLYRAAKLPSQRDTIKRRRLDDGFF